MNSTEYIESGILELYVFGRLSEAENREVQEMARKHEEVSNEILAIERAVISLSYNVAPYLSAENYEKIRQRLIEKHSGVVEMRPRGNVFLYMGWAAALLLLLGLGFQYYKYNESQEEVVRISNERNHMEQLLADLQIQNAETEHALGIVRDEDNTVVSLQGQEAAPEAYAKVYLNNNKQETYVDISGLPEPPEGKVYQVWALKLDPLTPVNIGVLDRNRTELNKGIYRVDNYSGAQAFGITLEPEGGSETPTLEQLYTLGKV